MTSALDGESQELDAATLAMWSNTSAYFNGDTVTVELVAAPNTSNRLVLEQVAYRDHEQETSINSICEPDEREFSSADFSGRVMPVTCSGGLWSANSCIVSAGHCFASPSAATSMQFRVPASQPNCALVNPPVADQFPIIQKQSVSGGVGNDWAVAMIGPNNLGQTPVERYGEFRPIAIEVPGIGAPIEIWGYGSDSRCTRNHAQQYSFGQLTLRLSSNIGHSADTTGGNSGSAVLSDERIVAAHTHAGCPQNRSTRIDHAAFATARADMCLAEAGAVGFVKGAFRCDETLEIRVEDTSIIPTGIVSVTLVSDTETVPENLILDAAYGGVLGTHFPLTQDPPSAGDGQLSAVHGDTITATHVDADDGAGGSFESTAVAVIDCLAPIIENVAVTETTLTSGTVSWSTNEPTTTVLEYTTHEETRRYENLTLVTEHTVVIGDLAPCTPPVSFSLAARDAAGNQAIDDNLGALYTFSAVCPVAPPVPDGTAASQPLLVGRGAGPQIVVSWDNDCVADGDTKIIGGPLANVSDYLVTMTKCGIPADASEATFNSLIGNTWFLVLKGNGIGFEGPWGDGVDGERNAHVPSGRCGATDKQPDAVCP